jgi:hypothetical protein
MCIEHSRHDNLARAIDQARPLRNINDSNIFDDAINNPNISALRGFSFPSRLRRRVKKDS